MAIQAGPRSLPHLSSGRPLLACPRGSRLARSEPCACWFVFLSICLFFLTRILIQNVLQVATQDEHDLRISITGLSLPFPSQTRVFPFPFFHLSSRAQALGQPRLFRIPSRFVSQSTASSHSSVVSHSFSLISREDSLVPGWFPTPPARCFR